MKLYRDGTLLPRITGGTVATLGNFDGVHLGHQALLSRLTAERERLGASQSVVISFYPHPAEVLAKAPQVPSLTTFRQKFALLEKFGVTVFYLVHFTQKFSKLTAEEFVDRILIDKLGVKFLAVGPDARVGSGRSGTPEVIFNRLASHGASGEVVPFVEINGARVSSGSVRRLLAEGRVSDGAALLGRYYAVQGRVVRGAGRGGPIGIPTANISVNEQVIPSIGVYACWLEVSGVRYRSVANIGVKPTFGGGKLTVEVHAFEAKLPELYGHLLTVEFVQKLRDEKKFSGVQELVSQIRKDIENAKPIL